MDGRTAINLTNRFVEPAARRDDAGRELYRKMLEKRMIYGAPTGTIRKLWIMPKSAIWDSNLA